MTEWFLELNGVQHGPFTGSQLKLLAKERRITAESRVKRGVTGEWVSAGVVSGLFLQGGMSQNAIAGTQPTPQGEQSRPDWLRSKTTTRRSPPIAGNPVAPSESPPNESFTPVPSLFVDAPTSLHPNPVNTVAPPIAKPIQWWDSSAGKVAVCVVIFLVAMFRESAKPIAQNQPANRSSWGTTAADSAIIGKPVAQEQPTNASPVVVAPRPDRHQGENAVPQPLSKEQYEADPGKFAEQLLKSQLAPAFDSMSRYKRDLQSPPPLCPACGGVGMYSYVDGTGGLTTRTCPRCNGKKFGF